MEQVHDQMKGVKNEADFREFPPLFWGMIGD